MKMCTLIAFTVGFNNLTKIHKINGGNFFFYFPSTFQGRQMILQVLRRLYLLLHQSAPKMERVMCERKRGEVIYSKRNEDLNPRDETT